MATLSYSAGETFQSDNHTIYQVASGTVSMSYADGSIEIGKGGMLGALELFLPEPSDHGQAQHRQGFVFHCFKTV